MMFESEFYHNLNDRCSFVIIKISKLSRILKNHEIKADIQRALDPEHCQEIIKYQEQFYQKYQTYLYSNNLVLGEYKKKYIIFDGQHRYESAKVLFRKNNIDISLTISIIKLENDRTDTLLDYFFKINKNKPVVIPDSTSWDFIRQVEKVFMENYPLYLKKSARPVVPHLNLNKLLELLKEKEFVFKISEIQELNKFYLNNIQNYKISEIKKKTDKCQEKTTDKKLYLGIYKNFEWVYRILGKERYGIEYHEMDHSIISRERIPENLRKELWKKYYQDKNEGLCYVCEKDKIDCFKLGFEVGHVIPVCFGGNNDIENLRPICRLCNSEMGIENLEEYKEKTKVAVAGS